MKKIPTIITAILICFLVGLIASRFQEDAIENWYPYLIKPELTPPNWLFPVAWSILYICMGTSIGLILNKPDSRRGFLVSLFVIQLLFNFSWSITFFYMQNPLLGFINIVILEVLIIIYMMKSYPVNKTASYLFIPYALWVGFATYLNLYILLHN